MTALPAPIRPKLGKLIPLLSSDRDGEVVATVRAIMRTLAGAGSSLFDLAEAVEHEPKPIIRTVYVQAAPEPQNWRELATWCRDQDRGRLTDSERKFVGDMARRLVMSGRPTEKQADWLRSIYAKLGAAS